MAREDEEEDEGPLLKPLGEEGAPFSAVGEWLVPFVTERGKKTLSMFIKYILTMRNLRRMINGYEYGLHRKLLNLSSLYSQGTVSKSYLIKSRSIEAKIYISENKNKKSSFKHTYKGCKSKH